jgi:hypothetical protein
MNDLKQHRAARSQSFSRAQIANIGTLSLSMLASCAATLSCGNDHSNGPGQTVTVQPQSSASSQPQSSDGATVVLPTAPAIDPSTLITDPDDMGGAAPSAGAPEPCIGLQCQQTTCTLGACAQAACAVGQTTTLSGTVFDPSGTLPLYNVMVYVPNAELKPFTSGATCDRCELSMAAPVASAITDTEGRFVLNDVPVGADIPVVIEIGKWRRQLRVPVTACTDTALTDPDQTRLPRNQTEGDIPLIAIATGGLDSMECLPRRLGIDDSEFTTAGGTGRIHLFSGSDLQGGGFGGGPPGQQDAGAQQGFVATKAFTDTLNGGASFTQATDLWGTVDALSKYDIVILSCEGDPLEEEKPPSARQALYDYASAGGRVFASHWHRVWFSDGPDPLPDIGEWNDRDDPEDPAVAEINTSFPKGQALAQWLVNVGASDTLGTMEIREPRDNVQSVDETYATRWMTIENTQYPQAPEAVEYLSFNAPLTVPDDQRCGRVVYTDLHVSSTGNDVPGDPFPSGCEERELSSQEKAVAFMLFDLSACLIPDDEEPKPWTGTVR